LRYEFIGLLNLLNGFPGIFGKKQPHHLLQATRLSHSLKPVDPPHLLVGLAFSFIWLTTFLSAARIFIQKTFVRTFLKKKFINIFIRKKDKFLTKKTGNPGLLALRFIILDKPSTSLSAAPRTLRSK